MIDTPRAWSPGPWESVGIGQRIATNGKPCADYRIFGGDGSDLMEPDIDGDLAIYVADATLIALAPQMAEAILAWDEHDGAYCYGCPAVAMMREVVEELRAIGHDDD